MKRIVDFLLKNPIINLVFIGILIRVIFFFFFYPSYTRTLDSDGYIELSELLYPLNLNGYNGLRTVGYPIFITLFSGNLYLVMVFQFCLGIFSSVLWFKTLLNYQFSVKSCFLITLFLISFLSNLFFETCILLETLVLFNISLLFNLISKFNLENLKFNQSFLLALIFTLLVLIKPFYAFLPFLMLFFLVVKNPAFKTLFSKNLIIIILPLIAFNCL